MSQETIISVERLAKRYRLGQIGATTLRESAERTWHRLRGRDPAMEMGEVGKQLNHGGHPPSSRLWRNYGVAGGGTEQIGEGESKHQDAKDTKERSVTTEVTPLRQGFAGQAEARRRDEEGMMARGAGGESDANAGNRKPVSGVTSERVCDSAVASDSGRSEGPSIMPSSDIRVHPRSSAVSSPLISDAVSPSVISVKSAVNSSSSPLLRASAPSVVKSSSPSGFPPAADPPSVDRFHPSSLDSDLWALRDVSFEVKRGEVMGIIGRNGAGKSTLLKILSRITEPTSGRAILRGRVNSLLEVGTGFHPELTGRENIYLNGAIHGMKQAEITRKFDEIVAFSEVEKFIDTPVKRYSSGMYVRLAFAVAAHLEPEILLVDEVLAVGDLAFQKKCLGKMQSVAGQGRTVLFVSHNMAAVQSLCQRAILLVDGQTAFDGPAVETVARYVASVQELVDGTNLSDRTDREGGTKFRFTGVEFCDARTGVPVNTVMTGQELLVKVSYDCPARERMNDVVLSVSFMSPEGSFLFACRSDAIGRTFAVGPGPGVATCRIPRMPVNQGRYAYNVIAYQNEVVVDWVRDAGFVDVAAGDYYGTGKIPASALHGVFVDYSWE